MNLVDLKATKDYVVFTWDDGIKTISNVADLRRFCPCASCAVNSEKDGEMTITRFKEDQITILDISVVGNYAINILWKDGHNTGLYEYPYLREISREIEE